MRGEAMQYNRSMMLALAFALAAMPAVAGPAPCAGPVEAKDVRVMRVERNGDLVLEDGRAVKLEALLLPAGNRDHAPAFLARRRSRRSMISPGAVSSRSPSSCPRRIVTAACGPRCSSPAATGTAGCSRRCSGAGFARVDIAPERRECAPELYAAEAEARRRHEGIWGSEFYAVRSPTDLEASVGTFQIVEGKVLSTGMKDGRAFLDFGTDWRKDFKVTISPDDMKRFREVGVAP